MMMPASLLGDPMYLVILRTVLLPAALALLVAACDMEAEQLPNCEYVSGNLLADPEFSTLDSSWQEQSWRYSQHSKDISFSYGAEEGILNFMKVGREPWALLVQDIKAEAVEGKRVEFSADLKLDLSEPEDAHALGYGGGLTLLAKQNYEDGYNIVLSSKLKHEPHMGSHDWQRVSVVEDFPKHISYMYAGFLHQAGGGMQVRNPALRIVTAGCLLTVLSD